jgi:intracellular sulfur oxidation DsrE/DsrF family protein
VASDDRPLSNRRTFIGAVASSTLVLAAAPLDALDASSSAAADDPWLTAITGKHKQVFDIVNVSGGIGLMFADTYVHSMMDHYRLRANEVRAFVVARYFGTGIALDDVIWNKYGLGQMLKIIDPVTKEPSTRNLFYQSKPGDMPNIDASVDRLIAKGVVIGVCGHAIKTLATATAARAGVTPEVAIAEWSAHVIPGVHVVPSGVLAVAKAQEVGCTYCFGG